MLAPNTSRRSEGQQVTVQIFLGFVTLMFASIVTGEAPHIFLANLTDKSAEIGWKTYAAFLLATPFTGICVAYWRACVVPRVRSAVERNSKIKYHGEKFVWDLVLEELLEGRFVSIHTQDDWIYEGELDKIPTLPTDPGLYLRVLRTKKLDDKGSPIFVSDATINVAMFIKSTEVKRLQVLRTELADSQNDQVKRPKSSPVSASPLSDYELQDRIEKVRDSLRSTRGEDNG